MKVPLSVRRAAYERASLDDVVICEAQISLPRSFGAQFICLGRASNVHHRINRSVGGGYELSSLLVLCGSGTTGCHGWVTENPLLAREFGWALRSGDDPTRYPVLYRGRWARLCDDGTVDYGNGEDEEKAWT